MQIASYYFPNYHPNDARNQRLKGAGWSEWELVKAARPRFPGHQQPKVPAWGYTNEADPAQMAQKIDAAADHGVDVFIFDWYYYDDGLFLERALEQGFQGAPNNHRLKFALMWANHDWEDIQPARASVKPPLLYRGEITPDAFERLTDYVIEHYFQHPSYWRLAGRPYFSIYDLNKLLASFGSVAATRAALDRFRAKAGGLHLNAIGWGVPVLPAERTAVNLNELIGQLGFDSVTSYVWVHHVHLSDFPVTPYGTVFEKYLQHWEQAERELPVVYYPNVTMGWDPSPRTHPADPFQPTGYPFMATMGDNSPANFRHALEEVCRRLARRPVADQVVTINAWNEWTEGSYLEPDTVHGMAYLEAIKDVARRWHTPKAS